MKSIRSLIALCIAALLGSSVAFAGPREVRKPDAKPEKGACCVTEKGEGKKDADAKKDCCCCGEKSAEKQEKKQAKK